MSKIKIKVNITNKEVKDSYIVMAIKDEEIIK